MSTNAILIGMGALDGKELFAIEGPKKLALNSGTTRRSAKNASESPKTPSHRHMTASENNVQIFKCEDARGDCQILLVEIMLKFPSVNCKEIRVHFSRRK